MKLSNVLKDFRKANNLTMDELAIKVGVSKAYISMLEKNKNSTSGKPIKPSLTTLKNIALALNMNLDELINIIDDDLVVSLKTIPTPEEGFIPKYKKVPLLGKTAAGEPIYSEEHFEEYIDVHEKYNIDYCLRVQGDSMIGANIFDGDIVFVRKQSIVENGEIAVVRVNDTVTLKRFYKTDTGVMLQSENPKYAPLVFNANNTDSFIILGKAVILQTTVK